jgi:thiol-disulfide isomerase/thioredoxin
MKSPFYRRKRENMTASLKGPDILLAKSALKKTLGFAVALQLLFIGLLGTPSETESAPVKDQTVEEAYPGLARGMLKLAKLSDLSKGEILRTQDVSIKESSLNEVLREIEPAMQAQLAKHKFFLLEDYATRNILLQEARKAGFKQNEPEEELITKFLTQKASHATVSEAELKQFYAQNKDAVGGLPFNQVKDTLEAYLVDEKRRLAVRTYILDLGQQISIQIDAKWVEKQNLTAKDNPVDRARSSGKPTLVEFGAAGCVPCDMMQPVLENLRQKYQDRLNIVFIHVGEEKILGVLYGITSIPVQAFFDRSGKEVFRHTGFFDQVEVEKKLAEMGVN